MYVQDQFFVFYNFFMCDCMCKVEYANAENQIKTILNNFDFTSFFLHFISNKDAEWK